MPNLSETELRARLASNPHLGIKAGSLDALHSAGQRQGQASDPVKLTEAAFMQAIINYARHADWLVYHTYTSKRSEPGFPDLVMLSEGQCVVAEVKTEEGKVTQAQALWLAGFKAAGIEAHVWRPSDWDAIKARLA